MTKMQNALRAGAATLLASSLIFTSFQTFAENYDPWSWDSVGTIEGTIVSTDDASAQTDTSSVTEVSSTPAIATTTTDIGTDSFSQVEVQTSTTTSNNESVDNSSWTSENTQPQTDQAYSCPCGDKLLDTNGRYAGYCSYQSGDDRVVFHYTDKSKCPLNTLSICFAMVSQAQQRYYEGTMEAGREYDSCLRDAAQPCRGSDCDYRPTEEICYKRFNRKMASLESSLNAAIQNIPWHICE